MLDPKICCIKECNEPTLALGLCNKHWRRNKRYGSPAMCEAHNGMFIGKTAEERFAMQFKRDASGCWLWQTSKDKDGYGMFRGLVGEVMHTRAHRWSWSHHNGGAEIPKYANVCHSCDTPSCVNPNHLWVGTVAENQQDKWAKGRAAIQRGEQLHFAVLTEVQVREILADPSPRTALAARYGVSSSTIADIRRRRSWAHLDVERVMKPARVSPRKGKSSLGVTPDIVRDIRTSSMKGTELAAKYGVSVQQICAIRKRRAWAHVE